MSIAAPLAPIFASPQLRALGDPVKPGRAGVLYRIGLLLVAAVMLLLPLVYVALICVVGYLIVHHATSNTFILDGTGRAVVGRLVVYLIPIIVGGLLILFMIKPLFARHRRFSTPLTVSETEQPMLHAFVQKLADTLRAPRPRRIDVDSQVNASARFDEGIGAFVRGDLVMTIGLPLVEALTLRQFTAILAHELGHFAQGGGMRLTYLVRSINGWFARVVYERDIWDEQLASAARDGGHWIIQITALAAQFFVWASRQILKILMMVAHVISSFMLRQMEYDADRYAARVAGSSTVIDLSDRVNVLAVAQQAALSELSAAWREGRLCDNLPLLIHSREKEMPVNTRQAIVKESREARTGWFDSHPCDADRVARLRKENASGVFKLDAPASSLLKQFADLCCRASVAFYHEVLDGRLSPKNLVPTQSLVQQRGQSRQTVDSLKRYFLGLVNPLRPVFPGRSITQVKDRTEAAELLMQLRNQFVESAGSLRESIKSFDASDQRWIGLTRLRAMLNAGLHRFRPVDFGLVTGTDEELRTATTKAQAERNTAIAGLAAAMQFGMQRLELALAIAATDEEPPEKPADDPSEEYALAGSGQGEAADALSEAMDALKNSSEIVERLRQQFAMLNMLLSQLQERSNPDHLVNAILSLSGKAAGTLIELQSSLASVGYPYKHATKRLTLGGFIVPLPPPGEAATDVHNAANSALDAYYSLYVRILSDMAYKAERLEDGLGLSRLSGLPL